MECFGSQCFFSSTWDITTLNIALQGQTHTDFASLRSGAKMWKIVLQTASSKIARFDMEVTVFSSIHQMSDSGKYQVVKSVNARRNEKQENPDCDVENRRMEDEGPGQITESDKTTMSCRGCFADFKDKKRLNAKIATNES